MSRNSNLSVDSLEKAPKLIDEGLDEDEAIELAEEIWYSIYAMQRFRFR